MTRKILLYDSTLPYEGIRPNASALQALQKHFTVVDANDFEEALKDCDVYVHLHGPYFPKEAWPSILKHLRSGKGLIAMGGAPFKVPANREGEEWKCEAEQTGYHQQLQIHEALPVDPSPIASLAHHRDIPLFANKEALFTVEPTYGLVLHVTKTEDMPNELGSSGPMDAHFHPLLKGIDGSAYQREVAAPAVLVENTKGDFAGGRWILVNQIVRELFWNGGGADAISEWAAFTASGVTEIWLKPNYASYEPGDQATLTIQAQHLDFIRNISQEWSFKLDLLKAKKSFSEKAEPKFEYSSEYFGPVWSTELSLKVGRELQFSKIHIPVPLEAGFYVCVCEAVSDTGERRIFRQGFWGHDKALLEEGEMITCDRDYFWKNDKPLPVVGMTYMTSDVARKFLFMPNVAIWDRDMAQMKRSGINMIRTGIWSAWRSVMFIDGHAYEEVLKAIDAFFLTAKRYDLEVTFNFFAFTPETWEGLNPYLDPRSVEAQKRFIAAIVSRHAESTHVHWDLINEPSMFDPKRIFSGPRTSGDRFEHKAFVEWLQARHGSLRILQEKWNMTPDELPDFTAVKLPELSTDLLSGPALDYTMFTLDMHNRWALQLIETIRALQPKQLVTVGQDEGLAGQRPSPFFYAEVVDYTTVHSWWKMDDLVWDGVFTKDTFKPNLIQETGIMYVETPDGRAKRSEEELRNILERKYAYAFSTGGAGAIQWIWNINFYMNNVNESNIGALRADGTEKPEANVSYDFGAFMEQIKDLFVGRELEATVVVYPYSNDFSNRKLAYEATTRAVRTLSYEMNIHVRGIGEYHLDSLNEHPPKLILLPSAHNFSDKALTCLIEHVKENGGTLLITGPVGLDEYWRPVNRLTEEVHAAEISNLLREEALDIDGKLSPVSFGGSRIADSCKQLVRDFGEQADGQSSRSKASQIIEAEIGRGQLMWCPLPMELNQRTESLIALYKYSLNKASLPLELEWLSGGDLPGIYGRKLAFTKGFLYVFVSEYSHAVDIEVKDPITGGIYSFTVESERSVLFAANLQGEVMAVYRPHEVSVHSKL
jgi:hypothetical protein